MTMDKETFIELTHSMMFAVAKGELNITQCSMVLYACAQQDTTEEIIDLTRNVRRKLTDWPQEAKGRLIAIEGVRIVFQCQNIHGACERGQHAVMMTRIIGHGGFEPESVSSQHNFEQIVMDETVALHPSGQDEKFVVSRGRANSGLVGAFAEMFGEQVETIDDKVSDFRAELDAIFPSNPQPGKEEGP